jgi:CRISPR type I-E-associated protein CasB/Cse2
MTVPMQRRGWYWERYTDGSGSWRKEPPPGEELAALRSGTGRPPGSVPAMWQFYAAGLDEQWTRPASDAWDPPALLEAEHHALTLYGVHQQSKREPVHERGIGLGHAMRKLRQSDKFGEKAVDRRVAAAATATSLGELAVHLRGLVGQLRALDRPSPLDYSLLVEDLRRWASPAQRSLVRRRWGAQYWAWAEKPEESEAEERAEAPA